GAAGSVSTLVPAWTTTWYTSASSAPATFPARNDSATATSPSARSDDVRTAGPPAAGGPPPGPAAADAAAGGVSAAAGVSAERPRADHPPGPRRRPAKPSAAPRPARAAAGTCRTGNRPPRPATPAGGAPGPPRHRRR